MKQDRVFTITKEVFHGYGDVTKVLRLNACIENLHWYELNTYSELLEAVGESKTSAAVHRFYDEASLGKNSKAERDKYYDELKIMCESLSNVLSRYN